MSRTDLLTLDAETWNSLPYRTRDAYHESLVRRRLEDAESLLNQELLRLTTLMQHHRVKRHRVGVWKEPHIISTQMLNAHKGCDACEAIRDSLLNIGAFRTRINQLRRRINSGEKKIKVRCCPFCRSTFTSQNSKSRHINRFHTRARHGA